MKAPRRCGRAAPLLLLLLALARQAGALELALPGGALARVPVVSIKDLRFQTTLHQQHDFSCGSAALATLLTYHFGYPVSEQQVFEQMFRDGDQEAIRREGFSLLDMQRFLAAHGFHADGFQLPLQKLIDADLPAILLLSVNGYRHFVVVKGASGGRVLIGDPSSGTRAVPRAALEAMWVNQLLFVIHDHPAAARFNSPADWRAAPLAPLAEGISRDSLGNLTLPKFGAGDF